MTQPLFECAIKPLNSTIQINKGKSNAEKIKDNLMIIFNLELPLNLDIVAAVVLICHFFPSAIYRYRMILEQVVNRSLKTNKNNDLNRLYKNNV